MRSQPIIAFAFVAALSVTACSGQVSPLSSATGAHGNALQTSALRFARPQNLDRRPSWFGPDVRQNANYVFVSDAGTGDVYLYTLPTMRIAARVTGFTQPQGECSDDRGDVWVTDTNAQTIYELSHIGRLVSTLADTTGYPAACAWDPSTGNLAVMNLFGLASTSGSVLVYPKATGSPKSYANTKQYYYNFGGYDSAGNLFFDGRTNAGKFTLSELTANGQVHGLSVTGGTIFYPGMVQWSGKTLIVGDQSCDNGDESCVYRLSVASKTATIKGLTDLKNAYGGAICDMAQGVVIDSTIAGSDNDYCGYAPPATYFWSYPGGGVPKAYDIGPDSLPVGAALSSGHAAQADPKHSWMRPDGQNADLLYIADANGEVTVYRYWRRTLDGILTGFTQPMGMCSDAAGNVYVSDYGAQQIVKYAHGGTKPIATLNTAPYQPYDCSVSPVDGDLAVADTMGGSTSGGAVAIYPRGSRKPTYYTDSTIPTYQSVAYDTGGDLLVTDGNLHRGGVALFAWLPEGGKKLIDINVPGPNPSQGWYYIDDIQWDGKYFVLGDQSALYRVALFKGQMFYVGYTYLNIESPTAFWIYNNNPKAQGTQVVETYNNGVGYYQYPAGGNAIHTLSHGIDNPPGVTVSLKAQH